MKVKTDFITNSSSTSYVIAIPKNFDATNYAKMSKNLFDVIDHFLIQSYFEGIEDSNKTEQDAIEYYTNCFVEAFSVKEVTIIYEYEHPDKYQMTRDFGMQLGLVLSSHETGSEAGTCTMVPEEAFENFLTNRKNKV